MDLGKKIDEYYRMDENGNSKIKRIVERCLIKYGGLSQKDYDDFHSVANETFTKALKLYDGKSNFDTYVKSCLLKKFKTELTRRNRKKRSNSYVGESGVREFIPDVSLDAEISNEGSISFGDLIQADECIEDIIENGYGDNIAEFLNTLSDVQQKICKKIMAGWKFQEIKKQLKISDAEFVKHMRKISSLKSVIKIMNGKEEYKNTNIEMESKEMIGNKIEQSCEKSKEIHISISNIIRKMTKEMIRFDYPGQRESFQWSLEMKGNLISDILQNNPLPDLVLAEEVNDGFPTIWNLDGKQRCTTIEEFKRDLFKISSKVRRREIAYSACKTDENGKIVHDENGRIVFEWKTFDITNKKYSQLPDELKDKFNEYSFKAIQYINCTKPEIDYHIRRYNEGKQMTASQKGIISLGYDFASLTKSISTSKFFTEHCNFGKNDPLNGTVERIVVESMMLGYFTDSWCKELPKMFLYLRKNANKDMFGEFDEFLNELVPVITEKLSKRFNSVDSFVWLGLYIKMRKCGYTANDYVEFMDRFFGELINVKIGEKSFNDVVMETKMSTETQKRRGTKDLSVVAEKMNILNELVKKVFGNAFVDENTQQVTKINENERGEANKEMVRTEENKEDIEKDNLISIFKNSDFAKGVGYDECTDVAISANLMAKRYYPEIDGETYELYLNILNDWSLDIPADVNMFTKNTIPGIVGLAVYACSKDLDEECRGFLIDISSNWNLISSSPDIVTRRCEDLVDRFTKFLTKKNNMANAS